MAPFGRFVEIGKVDIYASARLNMHKFKFNVKFECVDLRFTAKAAPDKFSRYLHSLMDRVHAGKIADIEPIQTFPFSEIQDAFRSMQSGNHMGKIVMVPHSEDIVPVSKACRRQ